MFLCFFFLRRNAVIPLKVLKKNYPISSHRRARFPPLLSSTKYLLLRCAGEGTFSTVPRSDLRDPSSGVRPENGKDVTKTRHSLMNAGGRGEQVNPLLCFLV